MRIPTDGHGGHCNRKRAPLSHCSEMAGTPLVTTAVVGHRDGERTRAISMRNTTSVAPAAAKCFKVWPLTT
jgi:hypothetical protein